MSGYCQIWLTCTDEKEATRIAKSLLERRLIACSKRFQVDSDFWWKEKVDSGREVLLVMDTREKLFDEIETEVARLHSYDTFVLQAIPISKISDKAEVWLDQALEL